MGCGCNEQHNSNCFCQCEDLPVPQGPTGLQGIQGPTGAAGAAGAPGADGTDAFNAQLTSDAVAINLADTIGAFAGIPPTAYKYYNDTITTVFSLTEGGVPVAIDVANMALSYGGEVNLATVANVAGGIQLTLVRGLNTPTSNYGYVDMTYTHGALTFVKRFNVVYVQNGINFQVGIDDTSYVTDPQEGMELLTKSGQLMLYQGGAWIQILDIHQTTTKAVVLTGALYTLNLTSTSERIISLTGSGTVNNNITIALPVAGCAAGTEYKVLYGANMTAGTGTITVFGMAIPVNLYTEQLGISALYNGATWIVTFNLSAGAAKATGNVYFAIVPTVGTGTINYVVPVSFDGEITYIVEYPDSTDKSIAIDMGEITQNLGALVTRKVHIMFKRMPITSVFFTSTSTVNLIWTRNGNPEYCAFVSGVYDNVSVGYFLERSTGSIVPSTAILQFREVYNARVVVDYDESSNVTYNHMLLERTSTELYYYNGANTLLGTDLYK